MWGMEQISAAHRPEHRKRTTEKGQSHSYATFLIKFSNPRKSFFIDFSIVFLHFSAYIVLMYCFYAIWCCMTKVLGGMPCPLLLQ
jgi:hypothetical protein